MSPHEFDLNTSLAGLSKPEWLDAVAQVVGSSGHFVRLGQRHFASFLHQSDTLLVTFETLQGIEVLCPYQQPLGWQLARAQGWSHLCIMSDGDTWFRDQAVYRYFDKLSDDGVFDAFDKVLFYGAGPCAYGATAYSIAAPGASVLAIQPQATLDPRVAEWDDRFTDMRRLDFTSRYGFGPEMLDAAHDAHILYDPSETLDAMHAALYTRPHVHKQRVRFMGNAIQTDILEMELYCEMLVCLAAGTLDALKWARLLRARRDHQPYLRNLLAAVEAHEKPQLAHWLIQNVETRLAEPVNRRGMAPLQSAQTR